MSSYTTDSFLDGKIQVRQSRRGYRFSIDAVLLAYHAAPREGEKVLDLGTGCGIIALILASRCAGLKIWAVEFQTELADLAIANVKLNRLEECISVLRMDMKLLTQQMTSGPFDLIVSNPPFYRPGSGRINPDSQRAIARHEIKAELADVLQTTRRMLRTSGRFATIFPAERTADLIANMRNENLEPKMIRLIHSNRKSDAKLVLVEGIKNSRPGLKVAPPVYIYDETGDYTADVQKMFELSMSEDGRQKTEVRRQRSEDRGQRSDDRGQKTEDRCQRTDDRGQKTEDRGQRSDDRGQKTEDRGQMTEVR